MVKSKKRRPWGSGGKAALEWARNKAASNLRKSESKKVEKKPEKVKS